MLAAATSVVYIDEFYFVIVIIQITIYVDKSSVTVQIISSIRGGMKNIY